MADSNVVPFPSPFAGLPPLQSAPRPAPAVAAPPPTVTPPQSPQSPPATPPPSSADLPPLTPGGSAGGTQDYDGLVSNFLTQQKAQATSNVIAAQGVNPDHAATGVNLAPVLNVPASVIQSDPQHYQGLAKLAQDNAVVAQHLPLQRFLGDPTHAAVAGDDLHNLGLVALAGRGYQESAMSGQIGDIEFAEKMGRASPQQINLLGALNSQMQTMVDQDAAAQTAWQNTPGPAPRILPRFRFGAAANVAPPTIQPGMGAALAQGAGGLAEQVKEAVPFALGAGAVSAPLGVEAGPVGVLGAAGMGFTRGLAIKMAAQAATRSAGERYVEIKQMRDQYGNPIPESTAQTASTIDGVVVGMAYLLGGVGAEGEVKVAGSLARKVAERPELAAAVNKFLLGTAKAGALGGLINGAIYTTQQLTPQLALAASSPGEDTIFNNQEKADQFALNLAEQTVKGGLLFSMMHVPLAGTSLAIDAARAVGAMQNASHFDATMAAAAASKTRARAPGIFSKYLAEFTGDGNVGIAGDRINEFYQTLGTEPGSPEDPLAWVPDIAEQVQRANETGADVNVPMAELGSRLAGTPALQHLMPDLRFTPDGFTVRESQEFMKDHEDMFDPRKIFDEEEGAKPPPQEGEAATRAQQIENEKAEIRAHLETMMRRAGETPGESEAKVGLIHAFFTVLAQRLGVNPMEIYRDVNFDYRREKQYQAGASTYTGIDQVIDAVRANRPEPSDRKIFGPSLLEYLTEKPNPRTLEEAQNITPRKLAGGLVDTGGNLKSMGAGVWHLEVKTRRKLINENGQRLHEAAEDAYDARYFPEHTTTTTPEQLLAAIRDELHGKKRYPEMSYEAQEKLQFRQEMQDVRRMLDERGIDIKTASNAEVRAALQDEAQKYAEGAQTFEQKLNQVTGGTFTFGEGVALMRVYETSNPVTFWHEATHLFLSVMERYAKGDNAPAQLANDYQRLKEIAGLGEDEDFVTTDPAKMDRAREAQEKIVKLAETYGMEGKAPTPELEGVFQRVLAWFTRVYKSLAQIGAPINDELRGIFNRWFATDEAIAAARAELKVQNPVYKDAKSANMAAKQFARYTAEIARAKAETHAKTLKSVMAIEQKKRTEEWNQAADAVRPDIAAQVYAKPSLRAWARFSTGRDLADPTVERQPMRLSGKAVKRILGPAYERFPDGLTKGKNGVDPETVYMSFGYQSAADMLNDLVSENNGRMLAEQALGSKRKLSFTDYVNRLVDQGVDHAVREKLGDSLTDGTIEEIAQEAANNAAQRDVVNIELRALAKQAGIEPPPYTGAQIDEMVRIRFMSYNIKDAINVKNYRRAAATQANKAEIAVMSGKYLDAFQAKQKQQLALAMAKHAEEWSKFYGSTLSRWRSIAKKPVHPTVNQDFVNQVFRVLDTIGVPINRDAGDLARSLDNKSLDEFSAQVFADGYDMYVSKNILDAVAQAPQPGRFHYNNMTADDFQATHDTIKSIMKTGRDVQSIIFNNRRQELNDILDRVEDRLMAVDDKKISTQFTRAAVSSWRGWFESAGSNLREADGALLRIEDFFKVMDDYDHQGRGPMCELFDRFVQSRYGKQDMEKSVASAYETMAKSMPEDWRGGLNELLPNDKLIDPGTGKPEQISRKLMIGMALNVGNRGPRSNLEKLCRGMGWNADDVFQFLDQHMTQADWRYVAKTWEIYKDLGEEAETVHREVSGIGWEKINPTPIKTKWGIVEGGYYPIFRDHTALKTQRESDKIAGIFSPRDGYYRVNTPHGFVNARVDYDAPLELSLENVERGLAQVIHDIAYRKVVIDALKILDHPRMVNMVRKKFGNEYQELFLPWLKNLAHSANVDYKKIQTFDKIFRYARVSSGVVDIGFNLHTLEKHTLSALSRSIGEVGVIPYMAATREIFTPGNYEKSIDFIKSNSGEVRHRLETFDTLGLQKIDRIINRAGFIRWLQEASMTPISRADYMSTIPLWLAAYRKQMSSGVDHEIAVLEADRAVRAAHGSTAPDSLAAVSRGSEVNKLFTMFYNTFFSPLYQSLRRGVRSGKSMSRNISDAEYKAAAQDFARVVSISLFSIGVPAMVEGMVSYGFVHEGDNAWKWAARSILNTTAGAIPILRDLVSYGLHRGHVEYDLTPADQFFEDLANCVKDLFDASGVTDEHENEHWVKTFLETAEMALKIPLNQGINTGEYLWDSATNQLGPQNWYDIMSGLVNGPPK